MKKAFFTLVAGAVLGLAAYAEAPLPAERLQAMAREADTPGEHAAVAKHYRLRAEALDAEASRHEARAASLAKGAGAMVHKWPAMANGYQGVNSKAKQARRAAAESRLQADHHLRMAVEAQAIAVD